MPLDRKHILKNSATLLRLGIAPQDVERCASWVEAHLPADIDPDTWIPSAAQLQEGVISEAAVLDAREAFYRNRAVPRRLRRILDARLER